MHLSLDIVFTSWAESSRKINQIIRLDRAMILIALIISHTGVLKTGPKCG